MTATAMKPVILDIASLPDEEALAKTWGYKIKSPRKLYPAGPAPAPPERRTPVEEEPVFTVARHPPKESTSVLPRSEIKALIALAQAGDVAARNKVVAANMGYVRQQAYRYLTNNDGLDQGDYITEGALGLIHAIEKYDVTLGYEFLTYAGNWVKQFMQRALDKHNARVSGHLHVMSNCRHLQRKVDRLVGRGATYDDAVDRVASIVGITPLRLQEKLWQLRNTKVASLDAPLNDSLDSDSLLDCMPAEEDPLSSVDRIDRDRRSNAVRKVLTRLSGTLGPRERAILYRRLLPSEGSDPATLDDIACMFGLTRERIRQIEVDLLPKIARALRKDGRVNT